MHFMKSFHFHFFQLVFLSHFFLVCTFLPFSAIKLFLNEGSREKKTASKSWEKEVFCVGMKDDGEGRAREEERLL